MNKINISTLLVVCGLFFGTHAMFGQTEKGAIRVGGQLGYGTDIESVGIGARADFAITDNILLAPDLMYYFTKSIGEFKFNWFEINLNGNYLFEVSSPDIIPYVLAGINISILSADIGGFAQYVDVDGTYMNLNLGGGADFVVGTIIVFGEMRYALGGSSQFVIEGGVKFPIN